MNTVYFLAVLLVALRMLTFFAVVPVFFPKGTPNVMKLFLGFLIGYMLVPVIDTSGLKVINSNYSLAFAVMNEVVTGLTLGFLTNVCFYIVKFAGQLIDTQVGFSMISLFDPTSMSNETLLERLMYTASLTFFLAMDGHHMLIRAMADGFGVIGLGKGMLGKNTIELIFSDFEKLFIVGFKIAVPIIFVLLLAELTLGLVSRTVPQLNVMILGFPLKILFGLACFSMALPMLMDSVKQLFQMLPDIYKGVFNTVPVIFLLASEDKTEEATPKKKSEARKKGQIAKSKEVSLALTLGATTLVIVVLGGYTGNTMLNMLREFFSMPYRAEIDYNAILRTSIQVALKCMLVIIPVVLPIMVVGIFGSFIQSGAIFTTEPLKPKLSKINPISGFKKMFSMRTTVETIKDLAMVSLVGYIGYQYVMSNYNNTLKIGRMSTLAIPLEFKSLSVGIFFRITILMIVIAIMDYVYQRYTYKKDLRMTKQEVKEEYKQEEGDPLIRSKIRQKQRELATRRMMQAVPQATVVVTNPTHISVALKYNEGDEAPVVLAKGNGYVAIRIKEIAKENNIPIIENKQLARLIFNEVEIESPIPVNMYQAVAEILALIYKMKYKRKRR